jgi:preprotein translocase subunit SecE
LGFKVFDFKRVFVKMLDKVKVSVAALLVLGGIAGYYQLPSLMGGEVSILLRVAVIAIALIAAAVVFFTSESGRATQVFAKGAQIELKKMIWPSRQETIQGTLMVVALVILFSLFLWAVDAISFNAIYDWVLGVQE